MEKKHNYINYHRWLKTFNVSLASERKKRVLAKNITGDNYEVESVPFTFTVDNAEVIKEAPFVYVQNLIRKLSDVVASHEK